MTRIKLTLILLFVIISAAWLAADTLIPQPFTYFSFRHVFVQYSGVLAIGMMSLAMILATRPHFLERHLKGLDKMYRLHKWLGISALLLATVHWWWARGTKWMVDWGWLTKPERRGGGNDQALVSGLQQWLHDQRGLAESMGEWAFYAAVVLIALALIKAFPYRWFRKTHTLLAVAYLVLAWHSLVLIEFDYWSQPIGWLMTLLLSAGAVSAIMVLTGRIGRSRQTQGSIQTITHYPDMNVIEANIALDSAWPGHKPGQFAFVTSRSEEGPHPYTIASAWDPDRPEITFIIKALGDWTRQLRDWLKVDMPVTVEGPYGCFDFSDPAPRQIWIGAGIGVTPFIARMKHLARHGNGPGQNIDFFHVTSEIDAGALDKLTADAAAAGIRLHLWLTPRDGRLTPEQIRTTVPLWQQASVWFCGPSVFGQLIAKDLIQQGLPARRIHRELFEMR